MPPRRPQSPYPDFMKIIGRRIPVYLKGDLNARHCNLLHNNSNQMGSKLMNLINHNIITHIEPDLDMFVTRSKERLDII